MWYHFFLQDKQRVNFRRYICCDKCIHEKYNLWLLASNSIHILNSNLISLIFFCISSCNKTKNSSVLASRQSWLICNVLHTLYVLCMLCICMQYLDNMLEKCWHHCNNMKATCWQYAGHLLFSWMYLCQKFWDYSGPENDLS